jgi:hypothetical protein
MEKISRVICLTVLVRSKIGGTDFLWLHPRDVPTG